MAANILAIASLPAIPLHVLAADGAFLPGGRVVALPRVPASLLAEGFRRAVLYLPGCGKELAALWWLE